MMSIMFKEKLKLSKDQLDALITSTNQDVRQVLHLLSVSAAQQRGAPAGGRTAKDTRLVGGDRGGKGRMGDGGIGRWVRRRWMQNGLRGVVRWEKGGAMCDGRDGDGGDKLWDGGGSVERKWDMEIRFGYSNHLGCLLVDID